MDLKELLGDAYKEGMTLDEINAALAGRTLVDPESLPKSVKKEVFDKTASDLAAAKRKLKELEEQNMTAEEKLQVELAKTADAQKLLNMELAKLKAVETFVTAGLKEEDYKDILDAVVHEDAGVTQTRAASMIKLIDTQRKAVEQSVKAELLKNTPRPQGGGQGEVNYTKAIEDARDRGDMATVAALLRQQQTAESS